jgi:CDP-diacylglycerol--glycerol-3-phosphate 3-phosphatidyltransferase
VVLGAPLPGPEERDTSLGHGVQRAGGNVTSSNGPSAAVPVPPGRPNGAPAVMDRADLPDRVWTLPNALSVLRLLGVPVFLWLLLGPEEDGWALVILMVSGFTDWLDGKLARWLNQGSRLGALLDPAADRLYIVATLVALALRDVVPVWLVALLLGRELVLGVMLLVLRHYGYPPLQVHYLGKAATLLLLYAFPVLLIADGQGWLAELAEPFAWALTIWGTALYLLAGLFYVIQVVGIVRAERTATASP